MSEEIFDRIESKLDAIVRLVAARHIEGKSKTDATKALGRLGLDRNVIAQIVDTTPGTVSVTLSQAKSEKKKKEKSSG